MKARSYNLLKGLPLVRWLWLAALGIFLGALPITPAQDAHKTDAPLTRRVLILFGEMRDAPGSLILEQAVRSEMQNGSTNHIEFLPEYLDATHFADEEHYRLFQEYLGRKYAGKKLDLILVFPSRDYRLAGELPDALFPKVPVVFAAVNEMDVPLAITKFGVTGIVQRFDLRGTLGLILRLQPDTRRVLVVGGTSPVDLATLGRLEDLARSVEEVKFTFWTNRPLAELPAAAEALPKDTAILLTPVLRDVAGQAYFMGQLAEKLSPSASVPIYVLGGWAIGGGALGGVVVNPDDLGRRTGRLALRVLNGTPPEDIPIEVASRGKPMLDWRVLQRWGIRESRVPADSIIRFRPQTLWDEHRNFILFSAAIFAAQSLTIAGLFAQRRQRQRAEREVLRQRTELAHVTRVSMLGQLATALTHELNQPLGAILRNAEAAEIFIREEKPDLGEIRSILADIRKDDQRAGSVIERMKLLLKRRSLEPKPLDLAMLLAETVALARSDAQARKVSLALQVPAKLPFVSGDRVHLQQVLLNLIFNGMDAMVAVAEPDRNLTVRAELRESGGIEVSVSDCGTGIPQEKLPHLFEPFFTTKADGMGMGLAISQTIIEAHGGRIWGGNNHPRGAVFKFTLPATNTAT